MWKRNGKRNRVLSMLLALSLTVQSVFVGNVTTTYANAEGEEAITNASDETLSQNVAEVTEEITADDKTISSNFTLTEDIIVKNLNVTSGTLDLNGYQLTVLGNITQTKGHIVVNGGRLICQGNYTSKSSGYLQMTDQNDYVKICGDYECSGYYNYSKITAGMLEFMGDFSQTVRVTDKSKYGSFTTTGTSEVVFSGSEVQSIQFESEYSYFAKVVLKNTSEEGVVCDGIINSLDMERNSSKTTLGEDGEFGWKLEEDETYEGDLILIGDTLDLNGHTLHVTGNLVQSNGTINVNGGTLKVSGDYRMQRESMVDGEAAYKAATAQLIMMKEKDILDVEGNIYAQSAVSQANSIINGKIQVAGDITQKETATKENFALTADNTLVMDGKEQQCITIESGGKTYSHLSNWEVKNSAGVKLADDIFVIGKVTDHDNPVTGKSVSILESTTFDNNKYSGSILVQDDITLSGLEEIGGDLYCQAQTELSSDIVISGELITTALLDLNGHKVEVNGDVSVSSSIYVNKGSLICNGDYTQEAECGSNHLYMQNEADYVLVNGNFNAKGEYASNNYVMSAGTLELKGDFIHTTTSKTGNFCASSSHVTVFSGTSKQTVEFADNYSYFNIVEIKNESEEGVYAPRGIQCATLNKNGNVVTIDMYGESGWTLQEDEVYQGDLKLVSGDLNLNGYTLTVTGKLIQSGGSVKINEGTLVVEEDYRIQSETIADGEITYSESTGYLYMTNEADQLVVKGSFVMGSVYSHKGCLTAGTMSVAGDVTATKYLVADNFYCSDNHKLILNGSKKQIVNFSDADFAKMCLGNLEVANASEEGVEYINPLPVYENVVEHGNVINGYVYVKNTTLFENEESVSSIKVTTGKKVANLKKINGNLLVDGSVGVTQNLEVCGQLIVQSGNFNLYGYECHVKNNVMVQGATISVNKGNLICDKDLTLAYEKGSSSSISMYYDEDYICVSGDMYVESYGSSNWRAGTLELKGNFEQKQMDKADNVAMSNQCKVILSGTKLQTVSFESIKSYFGCVEIINESQEGVYADNGIHCQNLETNGNVYNTENEGQNGWSLTEDTVIDSNFILSGGTLDLQGHKLTIKGDFWQTSGTVKINGGQLVVTGDYNIAQSDGSGVWANLVMTNEADKVEVDGSFMMASYADHSEFLSAGSLCVKGDVTQKTTLLAKNFATKEKFNLVVNGEGAQTIQMDEDTSSASYIANLVIHNTSENGVILDNVLVTQNVNIISGKTQGTLVIVETTVFENNTYNGDIVVNEEIEKLSELHIEGNLNVNARVYLDGDVTVEGNLNMTHEIFLQGYTLEVKGNADITGASIYVYKGQLLCRGDLNFNYVSKSSSGVAMFYDSDYVLVEGNMNANSSGAVTMNNGTMELKGDFTQSSYGYENAFSQKVTCKTVLSGNVLQTIRIIAEESKFGTLILKNESAEGVYFKGNAIRALNVERNGCRLRCDGTGTYGWTLSEDIIIEGDLNIITDTLDLNGHTLTVNGNLYVGSGSVYVNGGTLNISGDFALQSYNAEGETVAGTGELIMNHEKDLVTVKGDFITQSVKNSEGNLTDGVMKIQGDFRQISSTGGNDCNFVPSGSHQVIFNGVSEQIIKFEDYEESYFNDVKFNNTKESIVLESNIIAKGTVIDKVQCVSATSDKYLYIKDITQLKDGFFGGNIVLSDDCTLADDVAINGILRSNKMLYLNGYDMTVFKLEKTDGTLYIDNGGLYVEGDMNIHTYASVQMNHEDAYILVKGNLTMNSRCEQGDNIWSAGTLEVCGDIKVNNSCVGFIMDGTHCTILSGKVTKSGRDYIQSVDFGTSTAKFNKLVLEKNIDKCYQFSKDVVSMCNTLVMKDSDMEAPVAVTGLVAKEIATTTISLEWEATTDNVGVEGYQIYRDSKLVGITYETSYTDTRLNPKTSYVYTVCAFDALENISDSSKEVTAVTLNDTQAPAKPTGIKVATQTGSAVTIAWNKGKDNVKVMGYCIYRDGIQTTTLDSSENTYKDTQLEVGDTHTYQVSAVDAAGNESELSDKVNGMAVMPQLTQVLPMDGAVIGGDTIELKAYYKNHGNSVGNGVRFQYSTDEGTTWEDLNNYLAGQYTQDADTLYSTYNWDISKLNNGTCRIRTILYDADGNTDTKEVTYQIDTEGPATPEYIDAVSDNGVVTVSWSESDYVNCDKYEVYRCELSPELELIGTIKLIGIINGRTNTCYEDKEVESGKTYLYYVIPVDVYNQKGEATEQVSVSVTMDGQNPIVDALTANQERVNSNITFTVRATDNLEVVSRAVQYLKNGEWITLGTTTNADGKITVTEVLPEDGTYQFRAVAVDANGNQGVSGEMQFTVDTVGVEKASIYEVTSTTNSVRITWDAPTDNDFDYYVVEQLQDGEFKEVEKEGETLGVYVRNLKQNTEYKFRMIGYDDVGNPGEASDVIIIKTQNDTVRPAVKRFDPAIEYYQNSIPLSIQATDDSELGALKIFYSTDKEQWVEATTLYAPAERVSYVYEYDLDITEISEGEVYVRVELEDACGNVYEKEVIRTFYRDMTAPAQVSTIVATGEDGYIALSWEYTKEEYPYFNLYRLNDKTGKYDCIAKEITTTTYYDTSVNADKTYSYKLQVVDQAENKSEYSKIVHAKCQEDTEKPIVYGVAPKSDSTIGVNESIRTLVADNRMLESITIEYRQKDSGDIWTVLYEQTANRISEEVAVVWNNEELPDGDYEFRVYAEDVKGNASDVYTVMYHFSKTPQETEDEEIKDGNEETEETISKVITAVAKTSRMQRATKEYTFDASESVSTDSCVATYQWDFGDGSTGDGARVTHVYEKKGDYQVTLTVTDQNGNESSVTTPVTVVRKSSGGTSICVNSESGELLSNAYVYIEDKNGNVVVSTRCDDVGEAIVALESGTYTVSVYADNYLPASRTVKVTPGATKDIDFQLERNQVIVGSITHRQLDISEMEALGIDLENEDNWYTNTYSYVVYKNGKPTKEKYTFNLGRGKLYHYDSYIFGTASGEGGENLLIVYRTEKWLKQMFHVQVNLLNQAAETFTVTDGTLGLELPYGLSLAAMTAGNEQSISVDIPDMPGQTSYTVDWYVRGDEPGAYNPEAYFNGTLQPFNAPVSAKISSETPVVVTDENENTSTDDGFLDDDTEDDDDNSGNEDGDDDDDGGDTKKYCIHVSDQENNSLKGVYVELSYNGLSTRGLTDDHGNIDLEVNEDDDRIFELKAVRDGYQAYSCKNYTLNSLDYDSISMLEDGSSKSVWFDELNTDYDGDFALEYAVLNNETLATTLKREINTFYDGSEQLELYFSENAKKVQIILRADGKEDIIIKEEDENANYICSHLLTTDMVVGMDMYVRAIDDKTGNWHEYKLDSVEIVYNEPENPECDDVSYSQETAEQCATYAALAYQFRQKGLFVKKWEDGFSYDTKMGCITDKPDSEHDLSNITCQDLKQKLNADGFIIDEEYYQVNYDDSIEENCSFSIAHRDSKNKDYREIYVIIRGTDTVEWYGNMDVTGKKYDSTEENHQSFKSAADCVKAKLNKYLEKYSVEHTKVVITGHSRGAAAANLLAKELIDNKNGLDAVVAYTFATPAVTLKKDIDNKKYNCIYNFCFVDDFVPNMPLVAWGYGRYGITAEPVNSEGLYTYNCEYRKIRNLIRQMNDRITYDAEGTNKLIKHMSEKWENIEEYYNSSRFLAIGLNGNRSTYTTLYKVLHNYIAAGAQGKSIEKIQIAINTISGFYRSDYFNVFLYFICGTVVKNSIFSTHNIDNYYAALVSGGFDTSVFETSSTCDMTGNMSSYGIVLANTAQDVVQESEDINQFKIFLNQKLEYTDENGETVSMSYYEIFGWDIDDVTTWDGVMIVDGDITAIELPVYGIEGALDLSGFDKLETLELMYTNIDTINLTGCTALKQVTIPYNQFKTVDFTDCPNLEEVNVAGNQLTQIVWGSYEYLNTLKCTGNYLDIDTDETFLSVIKTLLNKGYVPMYVEQNANPELSYSEDDVAFVKKFLEQEDNAEALGWDAEDISTWEGVSWKTVGDENCIKRFDVSYAEVSGTLDVTSLTYVREVICTSTNISKVNISGCKYLVQLTCDNCQIETIQMKDNHSLLYLDCLHNYLDLDEIETYCQEISSRDGALVYYDVQYINASRDAFNSGEVDALENIVQSQENIEWDMEKPGAIPGITWTIKDGEYRVESMNLSSYELTGIIDLSCFTSLRDVNFMTTQIAEVTLPEYLYELPDKAFYNCSQLQKITFLGNSPEILGKEIFYNNSESLTIYYDSSKTGWDNSYWSKRNVKEIGSVEDFTEPETPSAEETTRGDTEQTTEETTRGETEQTPEETTKGETEQSTEETTKGETEQLTEETTKGETEQSTEETTKGETEQSTENSPEETTKGETEQTKQPNNTSKFSTNVKENSTTKGKQDTKLSAKKKVSCKVSKAKIKKIRKKNRELIITIKKNKKVSGYEIAYRKGKKGKFKKVVLKGWKKNKAILRRMKKGKYFVKVRAYKIVGGKKYYSKYTKVKKIRMK